MNNKKIKKSIVILGTVSVFTFSNIALPMNPNQNYIYAESVDSDVRIIINDKEVQSDVAPIIKDGRTLVPVRVIADNLGFEVDWNQQDFVATLSKDGIDYRIKIGDKKITTSCGKEMKLDVPAQIVSKRTMLPLRAIVEISGTNVEWDSASRSVLVNSSKPAPSKKPSPSQSSQAGQAKEGALITEASYNGKTVKITNKSWRVKGGDVWFGSKFGNSGWDEVEKLFTDSVLGKFSLSAMGLREINTAKKVDIQHTDTEMNLSDIIRKTGGSSKIVGNKMVIDLHPDQAVADNEIALMEQGKKDMEEYRKSIAHVPREEYKDREHRMTGAIQVPAGLGFNEVGFKPWGLQNVKDIKYITQDIGSANDAPKIIKNTGALKAGDKFAVASDNNSPSMGWKKGYYIFQIPSNAKAIHPSGDMRYGWTDDRYNDYAKKFVNAIRENHSDYEYDQSLRLPALDLTAPVANQMQWHKTQIINNYGMNPQTFGVHGNKVTSHYTGGDARMEVLAHSHRNLANWYRDNNGEFAKDAGIRTLLGSGIHTGILLDKRYVDMSAQNIYRPDLTEITVMTFGRE